MLDLFYGEAVLKVYRIEMVIYYLHLRDSSEMIKDEEGQTFANMEAAVEAAIKSGRGIMCGELANGTLPLDWFIQIVDSAGEDCRLVYFKDIVTVTGLSSPIPNV